MPQEAQKADVAELRLKVISIDTNKKEELIKVYVITKQKQKFHLEIPPLCQVTESTITDVVLRLPARFKIVDGFPEAYIATETASDDERLLTWSDNAFLDLVESSSQIILKETAVPASVIIPQIKVTLGGEEVLGSQALVTKFPVKLYFITPVRSRIKARLIAPSKSVAMYIDVICNGERINTIPITKITGEWLLTAEIANTKMFNEYRLTTVAPEEM